MAAVLTLQLIFLKPAFGGGIASPEAYIPALDEIVLVRDYPIFESAMHTDSDHTRDAIAVSSEQDGLAYMRKIMMHGLDNADSESLGHVQGLLSEWSGRSVVPSDVRLFRAMIAQQQHQFKVALNDLNQILIQQPEHQQARLTRASIFLAMGDYAAAEADCRATALKVDPLITANCLAQTLGPRGQASAMIQGLENLLALHAHIDPTIKREALTTVADLYLILNDEGKAQAAFKAALAISPHHPYLNAQFCELLLQRQAYAELADFLSTAKNTLNTRVYQAIADQFIHPRSGVQKLTRDSLSLFNPYEFRQDSRRRLQKELQTLDLREDADTAKWWAMYFLYAEPDATQALHFATQNWQSQKSLADARLLKQAAAGAQSEQGRQTLGRLKQWLDARGIDDHTLQAVPETH